MLIHSTHDISYNVRLLANRANVFRMIYNFNESWITIYKWIPSPLVSVFPARGTTAVSVATQFCSMTLDEHRPMKPLPGIQHKAPLSLYRLGHLPIGESKMCVLNLKSWMQRGNVLSNVQETFWTISNMWPEYVTLYFRYSRKIKYVKITDYPKTSNE